MPSKSKKQQRFFGMVHACQKNGNCASSEVEKVAGSISDKDAEDFARTKHKGLPEKKKKKKHGSFREFLEKMDEAFGQAGMQLARFSGQTGEEMENTGRDMMLMRWVRGAFKQALKLNNNDANRAYYMVGDYLKRVFQGRNAPVPDRSVLARMKQNALQSHEPPVNPAENT